MKAKLDYFLQWFREGSVRILRQYPVELILIVLSCLSMLVAFETKSDAWVQRIIPLPLFAVVALVVNNLAGRGPWRKIYWVCWAPVVPLMLWVGFKSWLLSESAAITFGILVPLAVLLCRRAMRNDRFVCDAFVWLRSGVLSVVFVNVALGLFMAIFHSTIYIFGLSGPWVEHVSIYALILFETLGAPILFLMMYDRWAGSECTGNRIVDMLVNYIVTPALLIYTAILYLYMAKILVLWELPRGGVAYLVFGFTLLTLSVQAVQCLLQKRMFDWFFTRSSLILLPTQVLFWVGTLRRVDEYGITEPRFYLLVCGGLMTLCVLLFLSKCLGRYFWVGLAGFVVFALMAFVPALEAERVVTRSQVQRIERIASRLGMLSDKGVLELDRLSQADSLQGDDLHKLYESLNYIEMRDSTAFAGFGLTGMSDFSSRIPAALRGWVVAGDSDFDFPYPEEKNDGMTLFNPEHRTCISGYGTLYSDMRWGDQTPCYKVVDSTLRIVFGVEHPDFVIPISELLTHQLRKIGCEDATPDQSLIEEHEGQMLVYADGEVMILFSQMSLSRRDTGWVIDELSISAALTK